MARALELTLQPSRPYVDDRLAIIATSLGTIFEWYDFDMYGVVQVVLAAHFFVGVDPYASVVFFFLTFSAGFLVRPLGAIVFGRLGDMYGRKFCFLITIAIMGVSTLIVGFLPGYATIGILAPIGLVLVRMLQGFAIGGEYGGAAVYIAEYAPATERGTYTSMVQCTVALGELIAFVVAVACQAFVPPAQYADWGWRLPFMLSSVLLFLSLAIRVRLDESPTFVAMQRRGKTSKRPLRDALGNWQNVRRIIVAFLGLGACQAVVLFTGLFYDLIFMQQILKTEPLLNITLHSLALILGMPFFLIFGNLSDLIGRKPIVIVGCLLIATTYFPLFHGLVHYTDPQLEVATEQAPVVVNADPATCSIQFRLIGYEQYTTPCDVATAALAVRGVSNTRHAVAPGTPVTISIGSSAVVPSFDAAAPDAKAKGADFAKALGAGLAKAGYPTKADLSQIDYGMVTVILTIMVIYCAMIYGPMAAMMVEMFPPEIRYTSFSIPYQCAVGWIGGFLTPVAFVIAAATGDIYAGLWYPVGVVTVSGLVILAFHRDPDPRTVR
jgi:sugar phosphate permease